MATLVIDSVDDQMHHVRPRELDEKQGRVEYFKFSRVEHVRLHDPVALLDRLMLLLLCSCDFGPNNDLPCAGLQAKPRHQVAVQQ